MSVQVYHGAKTPLETRTVTTGIRDQDGNIEIMSGLNEGEVVARSVDKTAMALIEATSLRKVYGIEGAETVAVEDISFSVNAGEFVAIMGPSGSGKSTLLHILGFLDRYTSGTYFFDGKEMSEYSEDELAHIRNHKMGFVFQAFNLLPRATVLENVKLPLLYSDVPEAQWNEMATKAIETVGLDAPHRPAIVQALRRRKTAGGDRARAHPFAAGHFRGRADRQP